jgi:hypothetical protein
MARSVNEAGKERAIQKMECSETRAQNGCVKIKTQ